MRALQGARSMYGVRVAIRLQKNKFRYAMPDTVADSEIQYRLKKIPEWEHEGNHIERLFEFDDFTEAIDFVNAVAEIASATTRCC